MKLKYMLAAVLLLLSLCLIYLLLSPPTQPQEFKTYPGSKKIPLFQPTYGGMVFETALRERRSVREFSNENLTLQELSQLLFSAQGITTEREGRMLRTAPSAGALYPIEIYLITNKVDDLERGIYHYDVRAHSLELLRDGDFSKEIYEASLGQLCVREAAAVFIFTAVFDRTTSKYGEKGVRYAYIEVGHISQNLLLQATSLNLSSVPIGSFSEERVNLLIGVDGSAESAIYVNLVGKKT